MILKYNKISFSLLNNIEKRSMWTKGGGFGGGDDPNKNNWNWLNDKFKKTYGEKQNISELQKQLNEINLQWENQSKEKTAQQNEKIEEISYGLKETLERFNINIDRLQKLSDQYNKVDTKVQEISIKVDENNAETHRLIESHANEMQNNYNIIHTNLENYINSNNANIESLRELFQEELRLQRVEVVENLEKVKKDNSNEITQAINEVRDDIDNIVANSVSNSIIRLINFILTFGGIFDTKFIGILITFICTASIGILILRNINLTQTETIRIKEPEITLPIIMQIQPQQTQQHQSQNAQSEPQVMYTPEISLIRSALIKALEWINIWLEKKLETLKK